MNASQPLTPLSAPVPELPVADVERAQRYYRYTLGFEINWLEPDKGIGAVSHPPVAIFSRRREPPFEPVVHWIFAPDIDATYREMESFRARITEPLEWKPWGWRQFTLEDVDGKRFYFHCN
ncbi:MAG TPA: VOC family protein [Steroidobacteraceae bacterium]|nr:VOC family protein [Steroidobacteraceae bacterium]